MQVLSRSVLEGRLQLFFRAAVLGPPFTAGHGSTADAMQMQELA
jgi:hypothetical protein